MRHRPLPGLIRPQRHERETLGSFVLRIENRIGMPTGALWGITRSMCESKDDAAVLTTLAVMAEQLTGLEPDTLDVVVSEGSSSRPGGARLLCLECAGGEDVELLSHEDHYCCLEHQRWTGPEPETANHARRRAYRMPQRGPASSKVVGDDVLDADQTYRSLRAQGRAPTQLMRELVDIVDQTDGRTTAGIPTPSNYVTVVSLLAVLSDRALHRELLDPTVTYAVAAVLLKNRIHTAVPGASDDLVEHLWFLLRPALLAVREQLEGTAPGSTGVIDINIDDILAGRTVNRPLEPFGRAIHRTDLRDWGMWCQRHLLAGQGDAVRRALGHGAQRYEFICTDGHRYRSTPNAVSQAVRRGHSGCPYCAGNAALRGFNSMAETHPWLAAQWHPERNGDMSPTHITGAGNSRKFWWRCQQGHAWEESPNNRAKGRGCPYCSGRIPIEGETSLDVTHPDIAAEWDFLANGTLKPEEVRPGSGKKVAWICPRQHRYTATVYARTGSGAGCPTCANLQVLSGFNDLATTNPEIGAEWDHERNGAVRPEDVIAGSGTQRHWVCPRGHRYTAAAVTRAAGKGCPVCAGQKVVTGINDLATTHAAVAEEWHPTLNLELTPMVVTAGSGRKATWLCSLGHVYEQVVAKRTAGSGCPFCANKKVLPGYNDLATRHPEIAADWHPTKNAPLRATEVLPGNKPRWWLCLNGHEQHGTVPNRLMTKGCTACPLSARAAVRLRGQHAVAGALVETVTKVSGTPLRSLLRPTARAASAASPEEAPTGQ